MQMISLCPACHARIHRIQAVLSEMPDLLLELWRELHLVATSRPLSTSAGESQRPSRCRSLMRAGQGSSGPGVCREVIVGEMEADRNPCRLCEELKRHVHTAQQPDSPELLVGLTEAGERNRARQREEKLEKAETLLARHRSQCSEALSMAGN